MFLSKYSLYIPEETNEVNKDSVVVANAMMVELLNYGILVDVGIVQRLMRFQPEEAKHTAYEIMKEFTIGNVNPPLFDGWEDRTYFSFGEFIVQITAYMFQVSGNDLHNENYLEELKSRIDLTSTKTLKLVTESEASDYIASLSKTGQSLQQQKAIKNFSKIAEPTSYIESDEARVSMLLAHGIDKLEEYRAKPADVLRYFAARKDFDYIKLPHGSMYDSMTWQERKKAYAYLSSFDMEYILEAMGNNRAAWKRFFYHTHLFHQPELLLKYTDFAACAWVSVGNKLKSTPVSIQKMIAHMIAIDIVNVTDEGALAYRTFASRAATAIEEKDYDAICDLMRKRPGYLLRNISTISNAIKPEYTQNFIALCADSIMQAKPDVLFSILQIDTAARYRIIDVKGDTIVQEAGYSPIITAIQNKIEEEIRLRYGIEGTINVSDSLAGKVVPFLAKNQELYRGTRIPFKDEKYLHFFLHWVQDKNRTDLDHSHIIFHEHGDHYNTEEVAFYSQANDFVSQSGDITNAPRPNGATEYSVYKLDNIPKSVKYIVPVINVYSGDDFKELSEAYAGFMFNESRKFNINADHVRYDLRQPARMNVPFVIDMKSHEIIIVDYNSRSGYRGTRIAADFTDTLIKIIDASQTMNKITIDRFAELLSCGGDIQMTITDSPVSDNEISPSELSRFINE
jgi:stress response protein SCP2